MRDLVRQRAAERSGSCAAPRHETPVPPDVRLLVQRLRVEAVLRQFGFVLRVGGNRIEIHFDTHVTVIEFTFDPDGRFAISIRAMLGEVILVESARAFAEDRNREAGLARIEIDEAGAVSVAWRHAFQDEVDGGVLRNGISQVCELADSVHPTLVEDYYLKGVNWA